MTFCESDEDIVVGDEGLYGRHYFDSSNSQRTSNMIPNIADVFKSISTPHLHSEIASFSVAENNIEFSKETYLSQGKMMLSSNILVENGSKNCVLDKEDSRERYWSCQDFQKVALSWMTKIDKKMSSLSRCGGNTPYKSAFAFGKLLKRLF
ncbi:uncharacterized protein LOC136088768 [Hydra vulgaris]|uniref:Uncharacterized protein LOC136088768 n=1 Tax=Hydra vulgaris TaxID=6087 RepID=A0ABM4D5C8_HYDVU